MRDRFHKPIDVGDWVEVVTQPIIYNPHIKMVGYIGQIEEVHEDAVVIVCINGGRGSVENSCVKKIKEPTFWQKEKLRHVY